PGYDSATPPWRSYPAAPAGARVTLVSGHSGKARTWQVETPRGPAAVELTPPAGKPVALLVLGHGAGGGIDAPDLQAVRAAALGAGLAVARVTQPYRVAGRKAPAPANQLDEAWRAVVSHLRD